MPNEECLHDVRSGFDTRQLINQGVVHKVAHDQNSPRFPDLSRARSIENRPMALSCLDKFLPLSPNKDTIDS
jgi:hypothetical protein